MLGQLDALDNALAGPNAANALRFDNVGTTSRPERKCPTPMLVVSPGRSPNCYAMKADRSEHGGRSGTPGPGHGEEGCPAVLESDEDNPGTYSVQRWQLPFRLSFVVQADIGAGAGR